MIDRPAADRYESLEFLVLTTLALAVPVVFSTRVFWIFSLPKLALVQTGLAALLIVHGLRRLHGDGREITREDKILVIFLALAALATFFSIDRTAAFFGKPGRYEGFLTYCLYALTYFFASRLDWTGRRYRLLCNLLAAGGASVASYAILQTAGIDYRQWNSLPFEAGRAFSTFGNPSFLAGYLAMCLPVALAPALSEKRLWQRLPRLFAAAAIAVGLLITMTRGGWLASVTGLTLLALLSRRRKEFSGGRIPAGIAVIALAVIGAATALSLSGKADFSGRVQAAWKSDGSAGERLAIWRVAGSLIEDRPLLGHGPDTFRWASAPKDTLARAKIAGGRSLLDNAHNYPLQLAVTLGVPAAVCLAVFMSLILAAGLRAKRFEDEGLIAMTGLIAGAGAYLTALLFSINVVGSGFVFWVLLGAISAPRPLSAVVEDKAVRLRDKGLACLSVLTAAFLIIWSAVFTLADNSYLEGRRLFASGRFVEASPFLAKAAALNPFNGEYHFSRGELFLAQAIKNPQAFYFDSARKHFAAAIRVAPLESDYHMFLGQNFLFYSDNLAIDRYPQARTALTRAKQLWPYNPATRYLLAVVDIRQGRFRQALAELETALTLRPRFPAAHEAAGIAWEKLGRRRKAVEAYRRALILDPTLSDSRAAFERLTNRRANEVR